MKLGDMRVAHPAVPPLFSLLFLLLFFLFAISEGIYSPNHLCMGAPFMRAFAFAHERVGLPQQPRGSISPMMKWYSPRNRGDPIPLMTSAQHKYLAAKRRDHDDKTGHERGTPMSYHLKPAGFSA